jgi:hypothetical protein
MSFLKLNGDAGAFLVALAVLAASCQAARAETIVLTCQSSQIAAPALIKINTGNNTVVDGGNSGRGWLEPGTYPARITDEEISWDEGGFIVKLNRMTGNLHMSGYGTSTGAEADEQCHKTEKQF